MSFMNALSKQWHNWVGQIVSCLDLNLANFIYLALHPSDPQMRKLKTGTGANISFGQASFLSYAIPILTKKLIADFLFALDVNLND